MPICEKVVFNKLRKHRLKQDREIFQCNLDDIKKRYIGRLNVTRRLI